jgi:drug/metabolite transporter (DMT)-like permease
VAAVLALLASLLWGAGDFGGGYLSRRLPVVVVIAASQTAALALTAAALGVTAATGSVSWDTSAVVWGVVSGFAGMIGLISFYSGLASGAMGVVAPIASLGLAVPVAVGLARGDRPSVLQIAGILVAVVGVVLVARSPVDPSAVTGAVATGTEAGVGSSARDAAVHRRSVVYALVAAVGFGVGILAVAEGSGGSGNDSGGQGQVFVTLLAQRLVDVAVAVVAVAVIRAGRTMPRRADLAPLAAVGFLDITANGAIGLASQRGLVSVVAVLSSLYPVVTTLLARQLLGERLGRTQLGGVAVTVVGVVLLGAG